MQLLARITLTFAFGLALTLGGVPTSALGASSRPTTLAQVKPRPRPNPKHKGVIHGAQILIAYGAKKGSKVKRTRAQAQRLDVGLEFERCCIDHPGIGSCP